MPAAAAFCEARRQYGCSGHEKLLAYSVIPALVVATGGTTVSADRSMSFQTLNRTSLLDAMAQFGHFADSAAVSSEPAALVAAADAVVFDSAHGLPRSAVAFRDAICEVKALAQGCSTSPLLEAITLATALEQHSTPKGAVLHGAHDDLQLSWQQGTDLSSISLPDTSSIGGVYNAAKAIAVGKDARAAVAAGLAAVAAPHTTVWGRPVGDLVGWLKERWLPKWHKRVAGLRALIAVDADLAAESMYRLRGPGAAARHWLRGTPPALLTDAVTALLAACDSQWVDLWTLLAGHDPANIDGPLRQRLNACVFGTLAQEAAATSAAYEAATGMRSVFAELVDTARRSGLDPRPWGRALQLAPSPTPPHPRSTRTSSASAHASSTNASRPSHRCAKRMPTPTCGLQPSATPAPSVAESTPPSPIAHSAPSPSQPRRPSACRSGPSSRGTLPRPDPLPAASVRPPIFTKAGGTVQQGSTPRRPSHPKKPDDCPRARTSTTTESTSPYVNISHFLRPSNADMTPSCVSQSASRATAASMRRCMTCPSARRPD